MAIDFACPQCRRTLRVSDEYAGQQGQCPSCNATFAIPRTPPAPPPGAPVQLASQAGGPPPLAPGHYIPPPPGGADYGATPLSPGWGAVRAGLTMTFTGALILFLSFVSWILLSVVVALADQGPPDEAVGVIGLILMLLILLGALLAFVGHSLGIAAPQGAAKGLAIAVVVCDLAAIGLLVAIIAAIADLMPQQFRDPELFFEVAREQVGVLALVFAAALLIEIVVFAFFVRAVARFFRDDRAARSVVGFLIYSGALIVAGIVLEVVLESLVRRGGIGIQGQRALGIAIPLGALVCETIWIVWYLRIIIAARNAVRDGQHWVRAYSHGYILGQTPVYGGPPPYRPM